MDEITSQLATTSLSTEKKLLYVDVLNFSASFFQPNEHWCFRKARKKVADFVKHAKNADFEIKVFIDAFTESEEAINKWRQRRENEVRNGVRRLPQGMNTLLGELFKRCGVEVCYSTEADNDDTLASHAHHDGASILSQDRDFLRYNGRKYDIFIDFSIYKKKLVLKRRKDMRCTASKRDIITPAPAYTNRDPGIVSLSRHIYKRGTPSPLTHHFTNTHILVRPLRQAYYAHLGLESSVLETFPLFDGQVRWDESQVPPDDSMKDLLSDPKKAYDYFFKDMKRPQDVSDKDWNNHVYATYAVVFEFCGLYMGVPLYDLLVAHAVHP
ncbi:MAG: hypothetical protein J3Q66DRAFT_344315 [Benniella sp.]|nr:MAG: hypothetical protein J3Q66DRAFT_344315 [Benniella sp.]